MILALDTYYYSNSSLTVGIWFDDWRSNNLNRIEYSWCNHFESYVPGQFYKRELPGILDFIDLYGLNDVDIVILDGFINTPNGPGLGLLFYESLGSPNNLNIVGIAKSYYEGIESISERVFRGNSKKPLYIQTYGLDIQEVGKKVRKMRGKNRIPKLLKILDDETKKWRG